MFNKKTKMFLAIVSVIIIFVVVDFLSVVFLTVFFGIGTTIVVIFVSVFGFAVATVLDPVNIIVRLGSTWPATNYPLRSVAMITLLLGFGSSKSKGPAHTHVKYWVSVAKPIDFGLKEKLIPPSVIVSVSLGL